jgi:hypothetical protein
VLSGQWRYKTRSWGSDLACDQSLSTQICSSQLSLSTHDETAAGSAVYSAKQKANSLRNCRRNLVNVHENETHMGKLEVLPCGSIGSPGCFCLTHPKRARQRHLQDRRQPFPDSPQFCWQGSIVSQYKITYLVGLVQFGLGAGQTNGIHEFSCDAPHSFQCLPFSTATIEIHCNVQPS